MAIDNDGLFESKSFIDTNQELLEVLRQKRQKGIDVAEDISAYKKIIYEMDGKAFEDYLSCTRAEALIKKQEFLSKDFTQLKKSTDTYLFFLNEVREYYLSLCYFPDDEIIERFRHWGVPRPKLRWMEKLDRLLDMINKVEETKGFLLLKGQLWFFMDFHFRFKIFFEIFSWGRSVAPAGVNLDIKREYVLFFRRLKEGGGSLLSYKNEGEVYIEKLFKSIEEENPQSFDLELLLKKQSQGKPDLSYKNIFYSRVLYEDISESKQLIAFYDFFKVICKDKKLLSEAGFNEEVEKRKRLGKSKGSYFDGDYDFYRSSKLKKLIFKR